MSAQPLSQFTQTVDADGLIDEMLRRLPSEEVAAALAGMAHDQGYAIDPADLKTYLDGLDVRRN